MKDFAILMLVTPTATAVVSTAVYAIAAHSWLMATDDRYRQLFRSGRSKRLVFQVAFALILPLLVCGILLMED